MRLLVGEHCLEVNTYRFGEGLQSKTCRVCSDGSIGDCPHMLFKCDALSSVRLYLWNQFLNSCPTALRHDVNMMNDVDRTCFILSGFRSGYVAEWELMYNSALDFVNNMYSVRRSIIPV